MSMASVFLPDTVYIGPRVFKLLFRELLNLRDKNAPCSQFSQNSHFRFRL